MSSLGDFKFVLKQNEEYINNRLEGSVALTSDKLIFKLYHFVGRIVRFDAYQYTMSKK
jgi:hypothetical protein